MPTAIVAVSANHVIGVDGGLPWHYSEDLKRFKHLTLNGVVIMGRKTWESIGQRPLPKRRNIVVSRKPVDNIECYTSVEAAINACDEPIWIIGGAQIYLAAIPYCDTLDITYVPDIVDRADAVKFPALDESQWYTVAESINEMDSRLRHVEMKKRG